MSSAIGVYNYGYLQQNGGTLEADRLNIGNYGSGNAYSTGIVHSYGGTMDFGGQAVTVASVAYGVGGGTLANTNNVTFTSGTQKTIEISLDEIMAGKTVPFAEALDLSQVTLKVTGDMSKLDYKTCNRYRHFVSAPSVTGEPTVDSSTLPRGWQYRVDETGVSLAYPYNLVIVVR